jgi:hypothetical protein
MVMEIRRLNQLAGEDMTRELTNQHYGSLPVPVRAAGRAAVAYFYCVANVQRGVGHILYPPSVIALYDAETGQSSGYTPFVPQVYGLGPSPDETSLGAFGLPPDLPPVTYTALRQRLMSLYDALLPAFATAGGPDAVTSREYLALFSRVSEPPLRAHYDGVGAEWFGWLEPRS